jgi:geranylgeranyl pyrophosphate synthase
MAEVSSSSASELLSEARELTDALLERWARRLEATVSPPEGTALGYALRSPGKRVRAALVLASYRSVGGTASAIAGVAAAVETVHAYSLVHDDLPCMDDDDLRRGRPTTHREFGVAVATLAGYLLVPVAARVLSEAADGLGVGALGLSRMAATLFQAGGIEGMVGGQWLDLEAEGRLLNLPELVNVHRGKTGTPIRAACTLGGLAAGADQLTIDALGGYGEEIGLAFQIADDVLDATGTSTQLGKTAGRDQALSKSTYVRVLGVEGARAEAERLAERAVAHLAHAGVPSSSLGPLADYIVTRSS